MTPEGFHFYLPAFVLKTMESDCLGDLDLVPDWVIYYLTPPDGRNAKLTKWHADRVGLLSQGQIHALSCFIKFLDAKLENGDPFARDLARARRALQRRRHERL